MSKIFINLLDGQEEVVELEGSRMIVAVGGPDGVHILSESGKGGEEAVLFTMDIQSVLGSLEKSDPIPYMAALRMLVETKAKAFTPEEAN